MASLFTFVSQRIDYGCYVKDGLHQVRITS